ncbi:uncharacterized protein VTP21DRAFT_1031 [Calcarisporiella thermophila]|uniref:uncharacterized protein n=1 Tax=Calcarisporiella thermophila TaxID=911321 RepID=UPI0037447CEB
MEQFYLIIYWSTRIILIIKLFVNLQFFRRLSFRFDDNKPRTAREVKSKAVSSTSQDDTRLNGGQPNIQTDSTPTLVTKRAVKRKKVPKIVLDFLVESSRIAADRTLKRKREEEIEEVDEGYDSERYIQVRYLDDSKSNIFKRFKKKLTKGMIVRGISRFGI